MTEITPSDLVVGRRYKVEYIQDNGKLETIVGTFLGVSDWAPKKAKDIVKETYYRFDIEEDNVDDWWAGYIPDKYTIIHIEELNDVD